MDEVIKPRKFDHIESYKHLLAKNLFASWLAGVEANGMPSCNFAQFSWRKSCGVFTELEFYSNSSIQYFEHPPKKKRGLSFIPDIVVFHQGCPHYIFEIVHKSPITVEKLARMTFFFHNHNVEIHTINADYLLNQIKIPKIIKTERFL